MFLVQYNHLPSCFHSVVILLKARQPHAVDATQLLILEPVLALHFQLLLYLRISTNKKTIRNKFKMKI